MLWQLKEKTCGWLYMYSLRDGKTKDYTQEGKSEITVISAQ